MSIRRHDLMYRFAQNQEAARSIPVTLIVGPGGSILSSPFLVPSPTCHLAISRILALHHPNAFPHRCMCNWRSFMHSCILSLRMVYVWSMFATLLNALNNSNAPTIFAREIQVNGSAAGILQSITVTVAWSSSASYHPRPCIRCGTMRIQSVCLHLETVDARTYVYCIRCVTDCRPGLGHLESRSLIGYDEAYSADVQSSVLEASASSSGCSPPIRNPHFQEPKPSGQ
ncbi:hypothetical protein BDW22DRAFT_1359719 [Trametopsis cervina]|nr:hypothetical protein BDW22DRAFT_1359719 [Trametopsis cervina]